MKKINYYGKERLEILPYIPINAKKILEVGCAEGVFLDKLKKRQQAETWGVELDVDSGKKAEKVVDNIFINDINHIFDRIPNDYFDCIIFNDVLEHIQDPYGLLSKISIKLNEKGVIVSSIPNVRYYTVLYRLVISKRWDYKDYGVLDRTHLRFFTYINIKELFENNGYKVVNIIGINPTKSIYYKIVNTLFLGYFWDSRYVQFVCVAKINE